MNNMNYVSKFNHKKPANLARDEEEISDSEESIRTQLSTLSEQTNCYFSFKVRDKHKNKRIMVEGSFRLLKISILLLIGLFALYLINILIDNNCQQLYLLHRCDVESSKPRCQKIQSCLQNHNHYYFSIQENFIIYITWVLVVLYWHNIQKQPKLKMRQTEDNFTTKYK